MYVRKYYHVEHPFGEFVGVLVCGIEQDARAIAVKAWGTRAKITYISRDDAIAMNGRALPNGKGLPMITEYTDATDDDDGIKPLPNAASIHGKAIHDAAKAHIDEPDDADTDYPDTDYPEEDFHIDFADPGSNSALRAATPQNPRNRPCPTCGRPNLLTPADRALGYQCNACANQAEGGY